MPRLGHYLHALILICITAHLAVAHDNKAIHPLNITANALIAVLGESGNYDDLFYYFNRPDADKSGYDPETNPKPELCKIGTQGTILEDELLNPANRFPFLEHYWTAWGDHSTWWWNLLGSRNAIEYAKVVFYRAALHFADGDDQEAFFHFGRAVHLFEDMGSVPHVFSDSHPSRFPLLNWTDASGYEKWCYANRARIPSSSDILQTDNPWTSMEQLGLETFRGSRIAGRLATDEFTPATGYLAEIFPPPERILYQPPDPVSGLMEMWWIDGVGMNYHGREPGWPNDTTFTPIPLPNAWVRVPNLPGEDGEYYYIEKGQDTVVPTNVWSVASGRFVPNAGGLTLAALWAGAGDLRATPDQQHQLIPRTTEYVAGFLKYVWDFVNPPPHLSRVRIVQLDGDGTHVVYDRRWLEDVPYSAPGRTRRTLRGVKSSADRLPLHIELEFSEPVHRVTVSLGRNTPEREIGRGLASERGPPNREHPLGVPKIVLSGVSISSFTDGPVTLFVSAEDLSNHIDGDVSASIDPDPSTRAGRLPDGSLRGFHGEQRHLPNTDSTHTFHVGGFLLRASNVNAACYPGMLTAHDLEVRNLTLEAGATGTITVSGSLPGWKITPATLEPSPFLLPDPLAGWQPLPFGVTVGCGVDAPDPLTLQLLAECSGFARALTLTDWKVDTPYPDHPDDTESVADPRYPSPWLVDPEAPVGILLSGWGGGLGHLLGASGIPTAPVRRDLTVAGGGDLSSIRVLLVGSGGLAGLHGQASFRDGLSEFVAGGGVLVALTPQRGAELAALPGGEVAGYGWVEDQACFGAAVSIAADHPAFSGQTALTLDAGADGYLTRWPEGADILLRRRSNSMPAMIRYPFGRGEVYVLTLYPDFGYGAGQTSAAERALVRDLVSTALAFPAALPVFEPGQTVSVEVPVRNDGWTDAAKVALVPLDPDRTPGAPTEIGQAVPAGGAASLLHQGAAAGAIGVHPVGYRLLDDAGGQVGATPEAVYFAVRAPLPVPTVPESRLRVWITAPSDRVPAGGAAQGTLHVSNPSEEDFTGLIAATWVHFGAGPVVSVPDVSIPAGGNASFPIDYPVPGRDPFTVGYGLFRGPDPPPATYFMESAVAYAAKGFHVFAPSVSVELEAEPPTVLPGLPVRVEATLVNSGAVPFEADVAFRLLSPSNRDAWTGGTRAAVAPAGTTVLPAEITIDSWDVGTWRLEAEVRHAGTLAGRAILLLRQPPPGLEIVPEIPRPWDPRTAQPVTFELRNAGGVPTGDGTLACSILDRGGSKLWQDSKPIDSIPPGDTALLSFTIALPSPPPPTPVLTCEADIPGGPILGSFPLPNRPVISLSLDREHPAAGESLTGLAQLRNDGEFVQAGSLRVSAPGLLEEAAAVALLPGELSELPFVLALPGDIAPGPHVVSATFGPGSEFFASAAFFVQPARLELLPPPAEIGAGDTFTLTSLNTGHARGVFDWELRLFATGGGPGGTAAPSPISSSGGTATLDPGGDADLTLAIPADLAAGLYAVELSAHDRRTGTPLLSRHFVFVDGVTASLAVGSNRPVYSRGEPIEARCLVTGGAAPVPGASVELSLAGSGGIDPVAFAGTVHVSPSGDDATGDGSRSAPYATIQMGLDSAAPGERVLLLAGTYSGGPVLLPPGAILQGEVAGGDLAAVLEGIDVQGADGATVDHLLFRDSSLFFPGAVTTVRVSDCAFEDAGRLLPGGGVGIVFRGASADVLIARNRLQCLTGALAGIQMLGSSDRLVIHGNLLSDFTSAPSSGIHLWGPAADVTVQENRLAGLAGTGAGIHLWGSGLARLRVLNNRFEDLRGRGGGIHLWDASDGAVIRGNLVDGVVGDGAGIHLWYRAINATVSDNTLSALWGDAIGIHLWGSAGAENLNLALDRNVLEDLRPLAAGDTDNGLFIWADSRRLSVTGNILRQVVDSDPGRLRSGIGLVAGGAAVRVARNLVLDSAAGVALRPPAATYARGGSLEATVEGNLLLGNVAGVAEDGTRPGDTVVIRDNIVMGSDRAGIAWTGVGPPPSLLLHNDFFSNAASAEGRPDPVGASGNIAADPAFVDAAAGDFRLAQGSPCRDAGSAPSLDIGPYDDDREDVPGPLPVPPESLATVLWKHEAVVDILPLRDIELRADAGAASVEGRLFLLGRLASPSGQTLATASVPLTVRGESILLELDADHRVHRPGEQVAVTLRVSNDGEAPVADLAVAVFQEGRIVFAETVSLDPSETLTRTFTTSGERDTRLDATAGLASASLLVAIAAPEVALEVAAPEVSDGSPFLLLARATNVGRVPAQVVLDVEGQEHQLSLAPGEERVVSRSFSIVADRVFLVRMTGDRRDAVTRLVRYGLQPGVELAGPELVAPGPAAATLRLTNSGELGGLVEADLELHGAGDTLLASWDRSAWVDARGEVSLPVGLGSLSIGPHRLVARAGAASDELSFRVVPEIDGSVAILPMAGALGADGALPVAALVRNDGAAALAARVSIISPLLLAPVAVEVPVGGERQVDLDLPVAGLAPGKYEVAVVLAAGGEVLDAASALVDLAARLGFAELPQEPVIDPAGAEVRIVIRNEGLLAGQAELRLTVADLLDLVATVAVPAGGVAEVPFHIALPPGLPATAPYLARLELRDLETGARRTGGFSFWIGETWSLYAEASTDKEAYAEGELVRFGLSVSNGGRVPAEVRVLVSHGSFREWRDVVIGSPPELSGLDPRFGGRGLVLRAAASSGSIASSPLDLGSVQGAVLSWDASLPEGCAASGELRTGALALPGEGWTDWLPASGGPVSAPTDHRFLQYRLGLSCPEPGLPASIEEIRVRTASGVVIRHGSGEECAATPLVLAFAFDAAPGQEDRVFFGLYTPEGRSILLDTLPLRRAGSLLEAATDLPRYQRGSTVRVLAEVGTAGRLEVRSPWGAESRELAGPGPTIVEIAIPDMVRSGTVLLEAEFLGEIIRLPIEVAGYEIRVLSANLVPASVFPGQPAMLELELYSDEDLAPLLIEAILSDGTRTLPAFSTTHDLPYGLNRVEIDFAPGLDRPGPAELHVTFFLAGGAGAPLLLAGTALGLDVLGANSPPIASVQAPAAAAERSWLSLEGGGSHDPDGDALSYRWIQLSGPPAAIYGGHFPRAVLRAPEVGRGGDAVTFQLTVEDGRGASDSAAVTVRVLDANRPPVADAGVDLAARPGDVVRLDGSRSYDPDGDLIELRWSFRQRPVGSTALLDDDAAVLPRFTVDRPGDFELELEVYDGLCWSAADSVRVSTGNLAPVADAGSDRVARPGDRVRLDGTGSFDPDGDPILFGWTFREQPPASVAVLDDPTLVEPEFIVDRCGRFVLELRVFDGFLESEPDLAAVDCVNSAPVADAGPDRAAEVGLPVRMDGSASHDPEGGPISFRWAFTVMPVGSASTLDDPGSPTPSFTPDLVGTYVLALVVDDGVEQSAPDTAVVLAGPHVVPATVVLRPWRVRLGAPPRVLGAQIELQDGYSAKEIIPDEVAVVSVRDRVLPRPVGRLRSRRPVLADRDRDGEPEMVLHFPMRHLARHLRRGAWNRIDLEGALRTGERFLGAGYIRARR